MTGLTGNAFLPFHVRNQEESEAISDLSNAEFRAKGGEAAFCSLANHLNGNLVGKVARLHALPEEGFHGFYNRIQELPLNKATFLFKPFASPFIRDQPVHHVKERIRLAQQYPVEVKFEWSIIRRDQDQEMGARLHPVHSVKGFMIPGLLKHGDKWLTVNELWGTGITSQFHAKIP